MTNQIKSNIQSLGFEISKSGNKFNAFTRMFGGVNFEGKSYQDLFSQIEFYLKDKFSADVERNEEGDEFVVSCARCGNDVNDVNERGVCRDCK